MDLIKWAIRQFLKQLASIITAKGGRVDTL